VGGLECVYGGGLVVALLGLEPFCVSYWRCCCCGCYLGDSILIPRLGFQALLVT